MDLAQTQLTTLVYSFDTTSTYLRRNPRASPKSRSKFSHHTSYPSRTNTIVKLGRLSLTNARISRRALAKNLFGQRRCTRSATRKTQNKKIRSATQSAGIGRVEPSYHLFSGARYRALAIEGLGTKMRRSSNSGARSQSEIVIKEVRMTVVRHHF